MMEGGVGTGTDGSEMSLSWSGGTLRGRRAPVASRRVYEPPRVRCRTLKGPQ